MKKWSRSSPFSVLSFIPVVLLCCWPRPHGHTHTHAHIKTRISYLLKRVGTSDDIVMFRFNPTVDIHRALSIYSTRAATAQLTNMNLPWRLGGWWGRFDFTREQTSPPPIPTLLVDKPLLLRKSPELTCTYRESLNKTSRTLVNMQCPTVAHALLAYKLLVVFSFFFFPHPSYPLTSKFARKTNHGLIKPTANMGEIDTHMSKFT